MSNEQKHTLEPWIFGAEVGVDSTRIETASGRIIGAIVTRSVSSFEHGRPVYSWSDEGHANARRIVACVNACAGIRTESLEHRAHLLKAEDDQIASLTKQRDDLLAALRRVAWEAASYSEAVEISKSAICETGILPPNPAIANTKGENHA